MDTCLQVIGVLTEYLEGDLPAGDNRVFEQHMDGCRPCHAFFRTYRKGSDLARRALRPEDIPPELRQRVHDYLRARLGLR